MDSWLGNFNDHLKMIVFGSGLFTNDVINLKHQGAGQKLMIGWHKHQGVSETPKNADVICEQPLIRALWNFVKVRIQLYCTLSLLSSVLEIGDWGRQIISLHRCVALALGSNGEQIEALSTNVMMTLLRNMAIGFVYYGFVGHITFTKCCTATVATI